MMYEHFGKKKNVTKTINSPEKNCFAKGFVEPACSERTLLLQRLVTSVFALASIRQSDRTCPYKIV